jgi:hypothetical protein
LTKSKLNGISDCTGYSLEDSIVNEHDWENAIKLLSINSLAGAIAGVGILIYLQVAPEKDMKVDPLTTAGVAALSFSASAEAIVSARNLLRKNNPHA